MWSRIRSFFNPDIKSNGYQAYQAELSMSNGGWFGSGLGNSTEKNHLLPTPHTDFIFSIIGEELGNIDQSSDFTWIIDPIDGTKAFISGIPVFTFLLSLKYRNDFLLGLVDQPILNERFWNFNNKAYLNNKVIKVRKFTSISSSLVAITDPIMFKNYSLLNKKLFNKFNFIRWGTDALGYMRCAEGIIDAVVERDIKIWDIAAIIPIIKASGGIITTWDNKLPGTNDTVIACNDKKLHKILVNTLQNYL